MSPLLQLATQPKTMHPNIGSDAMFSPEAFDAFHGLITRAAHREAKGHSRRPLRAARSHPTRPAADVDPCVRFRGAAPRRAAGDPTTSRRRCAYRSAGMAGPNPRVPTRRPDDSRSHPVTAPDRPLHPRSDRITQGAKGYPDGFRGVATRNQLRRNHFGPGCGPMLAAAAAWDELVADLDSAAAFYQAVIWDLTGAAWRGPSSVAMVRAVTAISSG